MTLPISNIVTVNVTIAPTVPPKQGFGTAAIVSTEDLEAGGQPLNRITFYGSIQEVADDWASTSEVYLSALAYFGQSPSPTKFGVIAQFASGAEGILVGVNTAESDIAVWNAVSDGSFNITLGAVTADVTGIDFSGDTDMDAVAANIATAIKAGDGSWINATCIWSVDHFEITNGIIGGAIEATVPAGVGTDISLNFMETDFTIPGIIVIQGTPAESIIEALDAGEAISSDWYGILTQSSVRDSQDQLNVAAWAEARTKIYSAVTNNANSLILGDTDNNAAKLKLGNYSRTCCTYSSNALQYPDAAVLGKAFTVNFDAPDSVITLKFKPLAGINTENLSSNQKNSLDDKRCNALVGIAGTSMYAESYMSSQLFFDERHGIDWMIGEIESNIFGYLISRPTKIPLTDAGGAALEQQTIRSLDAALSNGLLGAGTTSEGLFLGTGYITSVQKVADMNIADKANRIAPTVSFIALLAGAVHFVQINGVVER